MPRKGRPPILQMRLFEKSPAYVYLRLGSNHHVTAYDTPIVLMPGQGIVVHLRKDGTLNVRRER